MGEQISALEWDTNPQRAERWLRETMARFTEDLIRDKALPTILIGHGRDGHTTMLSNLPDFETVRGVLVDITASAHNEESHIEQAAIHYDPERQTAQSVVERWARDMAKIGAAPVALLVVSKNDDDPEYENYGTYSELPLEQVREALKDWSKAMEQPPDVVRQEPFE